MHLMKVPWPFRPKMPQVFLRKISQLVTVIYSNLYSNYRPPSCLVTFELENSNTTVRYLLLLLPQPAIVAAWFCHFLRQVSAFPGLLLKWHFLQQDVLLKASVFLFIDLVKADLNNVIKQAALNPQPTLTSWCTICFLLLPGSQALYMYLPLMI
jgi:hypothetical protein